MWDVKLSLIKRYMDNYAVHQKRHELEKAVVKMESLLEELKAEIRDNELRELHHAAFKSN